MFVRITDVLLSAVLCSCSRNERRRTTDKLRTQFMDQRINSAVRVVVLCKPMNFPLSVSPSKEMGDPTRQRKHL